MTTPVIPETPKPAEGLEYDFEAAFELIAKYAQSIGPVDRSAQRLTFATPFGRTQLTARAVGVRADDGRRISHVVTVCSDLSSVPFEWSDAQIERVNELASVSALVRNREVDALELASRISFYDGDESLWPFYASLAASTLCTQLTSFVNAVSISSAVPSIDRSGDAERAKADPSLWGGGELLSEAEVLQDADYWSSATHDGLTVEFPWDPGATSALVRFICEEDPQVGRTSLLRLTTADRHPELGAGLLARLDLPAFLDDDAASALAAALNRAELAAVDAVPFFGAWCAREGTGRVTFVCFLPNALRLEGVVRALCVWMQRRSCWAKRLIDSELKGLVAHPVRGLQQRRAY